MCAIYDELSAVSCIETIKEGFDTKIIICYKLKSELVNLVKILNQILPRTLKQKITLEFFQIPIKGSSGKSLLTLIDSAKFEKIKRISLALSPLVFPLNFVENSLKKINENNFSVFTPISGLDNDIFESAKEIGLGKHLSKIEKLGKMNFSNHYSSKKEIKMIAEKAFKTKKSIFVTIGPNNVHEILDALEPNH